MSDSLDPKQNHVTFHLAVGGKKKTLSGVGPTRAVDCLSSIWQVITRKEKANPAHVREIYSEWETAAEDLAFLHSTFPEDAGLDSPIPSGAQVSVGVSH